MKVPMPRLLDWLRRANGYLRRSAAKFLKPLLVFCRHHSQELAIAFVFALIAAIAAAPLLKYLEEKKQERVTEAIRSAEATIVMYDKDNKATNLGLGIFVSPTGTLITNHHILKTGNVWARLRSGAFYECKTLVNFDPRHDLSVFQCTGERIPYVDLGNSDNVKVGQKVYALLGLDSGVLTAFVSARQSTPDPQMRDLIEFHGASVVASNGGLFDGNGTVVGVVSTSLITPSTTTQITSLLAFPINPLKPLIQGRDTASSEKDPEFYYSKGVLAENKRKYDEATEDFKRAIQLNPAYADAYLELGGVAYEQGRFDEQLTNYKKAAEYAPTNVDILFYLATAYEDKALYGDAMSTYKNVLKINPKHKDSLYQLGILDIMYGNRREAGEMASRLGGLDPGLGQELVMLLRQMR